MSNQPAAPDTEYRRGLYLCPRARRLFTPSLIRPAALLGGVVWTPCPLCDAAGRLRGTPDYDLHQPAWHPYRQTRTERPTCDLAHAIGDAILMTHIVKTALHGAGLFGRALEFLAAADRCTTHVELLAVARQFVVVRDIPEDNDAA